MTASAAGLIGGWHTVTAALRRGLPVLEILLAAQRHDRRAQELEALALAAGVPVRQVSAEQLDRQLPGVRHQGCAGRVAAPATLDDSGLEDLLKTHAAPLLLVLDGVQDPHNLGACLRSAAGAGAHGVIIPKDRAVGLTPAARKVAAGGAEWVPLVRVTNLARCLRGLRCAGLWVVGMDGEAGNNLYRTDLNGPLALVLGGENRGLRRLTAKTCDVLAAIPTAGGMASLNVSVAAGICLFEALRQRSGRALAANKGR